MKAFSVSLGTALLVLALGARAGCVIVDKNSPINQMSLEQIRRVFLGQETLLVNGAPIVVIYQTNEATRTEFESKVLTLTGRALNVYWVKQIFTGKAVAPTEVGGDAQVRAKIINSPGAIGYVSDGGVNDSVKVVFKY